MFNDSNFSQLNLYILVLLSLFSYCWPACTKIRSAKHGELTLNQEENLPENCVKGLSFLKEDTGDIFCLNKGGESDSLNCVQSEGQMECFCGMENAPDISNNEIEGGSIVSKNQFPWHAIVFRSGDSNKFCGGSIITEKLILSAAHCVDNEDASLYLIGLGTHDILHLVHQEFLKDPMSFQNKGVVIHQVQEIILHPEREKYYDYALLVLQAPIKMSKKISPICLPLTEEIEDIETDSNIVTGYGLEKFWYKEYEKLTGLPLRHAKLINIESIKTMGLKIPNIEIQKKAVEDFYKILFEYFPGLELCVKDFEFLCKMTDKEMKLIMEQIDLNIRNSLSKNRNSEEDVKKFLEITSSEVLPELAGIINNWKNLTAIPIEEKMKKWYFKRLNLTKTEALNSVKFINQWYFIGLNFEFGKMTWRSVVRPNTLKMAKGKFIRNSQCKEDFDMPIYCEDINKNPSLILVKRSSMDEGFTCAGDSGGPIVVKKNGVHLLAAVVHSVIVPFNEWPPACLCCNNDFPEFHAKISSALPWIQQVMEKKKLGFTCKRKE